MNVVMSPILFSFEVYMQNNNVSTFIVSRDYANVSAELYTTNWTTSKCKWLWEKNANSFVCLPKTRWDYKTFFIIWGEKCNWIRFWRTFVSKKIKCHVLVMLLLLIYLYLQIKAFIITYYKQFRIQFNLTINFEFISRSIF